MVIYSSIGGTTRKVAQRVAERVGDGLILDARAALGRLPCRDARPLLLFCPTYGDGEPEDDFETLLLAYDWAALGGVGFAFCELGIYTGYEDFGHGLAGMVHEILARSGLHQLVPPLSIDAVPITDWDMVDAWADLIGTRHVAPE
jgi:flavodoxin